MIYLIIDSRNQISLRKDLAEGSAEGSGEGYSRRHSGSAEGSPRKDPFLVYLIIDFFAEGSPRKDLHGRISEGLCRRICGRIPDDPGRIRKGSGNDSRSTPWKDSAEGEGFWKDPRKDLRGRMEKSIKR